MIVVLIIPSNIHTNNIFEYVPSPANSPTTMAVCHVPRIYQFRQAQNKAIINARVTEAINVPCRLQKTKEGCIANNTVDNNAIRAPQTVRMKLKVSNNIVTAIKMEGIRTLTVLGPRIATKGTVIYTCIAPI